MKLVILEKISLGTDLDISFYTSEKPPTMKTPHPKKSHSA